MNCLQEGKEEEGGEAINAIEQLVSQPINLFDGNRFCGFFR